MIAAICIAICSILGGAAILAKVSDSWLRDSQKKKVAELFETGWIKAADADPITFVRGPIRALRELFDLVLGPRIFCRRAFLRTSVIGIIIFVVALAVAGIFTHDAFAGVRPWRLYEANAKLAEGLLKGPHAEEIAQIPKQTEFCRFFAAQHGWLVKAGFCVLFCALALLLIVIVDFISVVLVRQMLRELEEARGFLTFVMALTFCLLQAGISGAVAMMAIALLALPFTWPVVLTVVKLATFTVVVPLLFLMLMSALMWSAGGAAFKMEIIVALIPSVTVAASLLWAVISFPFKRHIHRGITAVLLRAAESGTAAFGFFATLLGSLAGVIAVVAKLV